MHLKNGRAPPKKGTCHNGLYVWMYFALGPLELKYMQRTVLFSIFVYFEKVINVLKVITQ